MLTSVAVLYEDDDLVAFDKPAGWLVIPSPHGETHTLTSFVNAQRPDGGARLHPCHRLDRDTSGVILYAKGKAVQARMMAAFQKGAVAKIYTAFVRGVPSPLKGTLDRPVRDYHHARRFRGDTGRGIPAVTHYRVLERFEGFSVVEVRPVTGRTNQIRIHFSQIGHPLLGERLYALGRDFPVKFRRLALHAAQLSWRDPRSGRTVTAVSPLAPDMQNFLKGKSKEASSS